MPDIENSQPGRSPLGGSRGSQLSGSMKACSRNWPSAEFDHSGPVDQRRIAVSGGFTILLLDNAPVRCENPKFIVGRELCRRERHQNFRWGR